MSYFKDDAGNCYFLSAEDIANGGLSLLPADCVAITDEEAHAIQNPPPTPQQILAAQSAKLRGLVQLASAQKAALANRIDDIEFSIADGSSTPADETELPDRKAQSTAWYRFSSALGRVSAQAGWPVTVTWPVQPSDGMDLSVSATSPDTV
ncbi:hypothetical protein [Pseudomonas sp.]|uniref:hypothetical protein n=1 Tax=Pseudomonas sp. TaxID=306 RepID=UPI003F2AF57C